MEKRNEGKGEEREGATRQVPRHETRVVVSKRISTAYIR